MRFEVEAGRVQRTPSGVRVGPFHVVTVAAPDGRMHVSIEEDGQGPVDRTYSAALYDHPLAIAYAVATFLGFMLQR
jgi:hypothetical protein